MEINYAELNSKHIKSVDKLYRQFAGLSSEIISFNDETIELKIEISNRWKKDPTTTAVQLSKCWRDFNECLKTAKKYKVTLVYLNSDQDTGCVIPDMANMDRSVWDKVVKDLIQKMNNTGENKSVLLTGIIDDGSKNQIS